MTYQQSFSLYLLRLRHKTTSDLIDKVIFLPATFGLHRISHLQKFVADKYLYRYSAVIKTHVICNGAGGLSILWLRMDNFDEFH